MNGNIVKICVVSSIEKIVDSFYNKYRECKSCDIQRSLKRYYNNKDKELRQRRDKYALFKDLDIRLKALEENILYK